MRKGGGGGGGEIKFSVFFVIFFFFVCTKLPFRESQYSAKYSCHFCQRITLLPFFSENCSKLNLSEKRKPYWTSGTCTAFRGAKICVPCHSVR
jgi:hypothetical protein